MLSGPSVKIKDENTMIITGKISCGKSTFLIKHLVKSIVCFLNSSDLNLIEKFIEDRFIGYITLSRVDGQNEMNHRRVFYIVDVRDYLIYFFRNNSDLFCNGVVFENGSIEIERNYSEFREIVFDHEKSKDRVFENKDVLHIDEDMLIDRLGKDLKAAPRERAIELSSAELFSPKNDVDRKNFIATIKEELKKIYASLTVGNEKILVMDETMGIELIDAEVVDLLRGILRNHRGESFFVCKSDEHRKYLQSFVID